MIVNISSLVAFVVKRDGLLTRKQNIAVGWGSGISITMIVVSLEWKNYGGKNQAINIQQFLLTSILRIRKEIFTKKLNLGFDIHHQVEIFHKFLT